MVVYIIKNDDIVNHDLNEQLLTFTNLEETMSRTIPLHSDGTATDSGAAPKNEPSWTVSLAVLISFCYEFIPEEPGSLLVTGLGLLCRAVVAAIRRACRR
jgi:hypothetical protein